MAIDRIRDGDDSADKGSAQRPAEWRPPVERPGSDPHALSRAESRAAAAAGVERPQRNRDTSTDDEPGRRAGDIAPTEGTTSRESAEDRKQSKQVDQRPETGSDDAGDESSPTDRPGEQEYGGEAQAEGIDAAVTDRPDVAMSPSEEELRAFAELGEARYAELKAKGELSYARVSTIEAETVDVSTGEAGGGGTDQVKTARDDETTTHDGETRGEAEQTKRLDGERDYVVDDPAVPGRTITDIDHIENGVLWEEKSATKAGDIDRWVAKHIDKKFGSYVDARQYLSGYEQAPIGFRFIGSGVDASFRSAVESAVGRLRVAHPGEQILLEWSE